MRHLIIALLLPCCLSPALADPIKNVRIVNTPLPVTGSLNVSGSDVDVSGSNVTIGNNELNPVPVTVLPEVREHYLFSSSLNLSNASLNTFVTFPIPDDRVLVIENVSISANQPAVSRPMRYQLHVPTGSAQCVVPLNFPTTAGGEFGGGVLWQGSQNIHAIADSTSSFSLQVNYGRNPTGTQATTGVIAIQGHLLPVGSVAFPASCF